MFDFSFGELAVVMAVALFIVGPKDLPVVMRTIGKWFGQFKSITDEFKLGFQNVMNETSFSGIKKDLEEIEEEVRYIKDAEGNFHRIYNISDFIKDKDAGVTANQEPEQLALPQPSVEPAPTSESPAIKSEVTNE